MNTEIVKELVRIWRENAQPLSLDITGGETAVEEGQETISSSILDKKVREATQEALRTCAQDLEDVIRIYTEFRFKR